MTSSSCRVLQQSTYKQEIFLTHLHTFISLCLPLSPTQFISLLFLQYTFHKMSKTASNNPKRTIIYCTLTHSQSDPILSNPCKSFVRSTNISVSHLTSPASCLAHLQFDFHSLHGLVSCLESVVWLCIFFFFLLLLLFYTSIFLGYLYISFTLSNHTCLLQFSIYIYSKHQVQYIVLYIHHSSSDKPTFSKIDKNVYMIFHLLFSIRPLLFTIFFFFSPCQRFGDQRFFNHSSHFLKTQFQFRWNQNHNDEHRLRVQ